MTVYATFAPTCECGLRELILAFPSFRCCDRRLFVGLLRFKRTCARGNDGATHDGASDDRSCDDRARDDRACLYHRASNDDRACLYHCGAARRCGREHLEAVDD